MPRYFFDLHDGASYIDRDGIELPDFKAAKVEAGRRAGTILKGAPHQLWDGDEWSVDVRDESGHVLFVMRVLATETHPVMPYQDA